MESLQRYADKLKGWSNLPEQELLTPVRAGGWSMRHIIGHIYYWDRFLIETVIPAVKSDIPLRHWPQPDIYNQSALASIEGRRANWVAERGIEMRSILLDQLTDLDMATPINIPYNSKVKSVGQMIELFTAHDAHHIHQIERYLKDGMQRS
ncbi:DinB family protein [Salisediminibacterium beveridgei]|uniref:DinB-like domain-containing protein n=1 Tax=Salisediminibacterium beveridgei TaxID=632773 RepID=A0A1D7QVQ4_9BACI|nr:DinB family protein [Salisediminibacterium beveridgei]AOM83085.1 hypothetical protein BBEV_1724 [Salisediminibacterium beveridgei]